MTNALNESRKEALIGEYSVNITETRQDSLLPETIQNVEISYDVDGYFDVQYLDEDSNVVFVNNVAVHRVEGALDGEDGYDIVAYSV